MTRDGKSNAQQEGVRQVEARAVVQTCPPSGLASETKSPHHKERLHHFLRALARELARADHEREG